VVLVSWCLGTGESREEIKGDCVQHAAREGADDRQFRAQRHLSARDDADGCRDECAFDQHVADPDVNPPVQLPHISESAQTHSKFIRLIRTKSNIPSLDTAWETCHMRTPR
jgi:hypothetical protein